MRAEHIDRFEAWSDPMGVSYRTGDDQTIGIYACETTDDAEHLPYNQPAYVKRGLFERQVSLDDAPGVLEHVGRAVACMNRAVFAVAAAELHPNGIQNLFNFYMEQESDVKATC